VISRSQIDVQPCSTPSCGTPCGCCDATYGACIDSTGPWSLRAHHNFHPEQLRALAAKVPRAPGGRIGRVIETRGVVCVADVQSVMAPSSASRRVN